MFSYQSLGELNGRKPYFALVVPEIDLISTFSFKIDVEPLGELASQDDQVGQPVAIDRRKDYN